MVSVEVVICTKDITVNGVVFKSGKVYLSKKSKRSHNAMVKMGEVWYPIISPPRMIIGWKYYDFVRRFRVVGSYLCKNHCEANQVRLLT